MSVIRFDANVPVEVALKFDGGKQVKSRIPEAPDQMMYSLCGDDTIYVPLLVGEKIAQLGVKKMELISICKRQQGSMTKWEVKRVGDTATAPLEQVQAQRALATPATPQIAPLEKSNPNTPHSNPEIGHTIISRIMASALIAAIDATQEAERYAHSKGIELEFGTDDIRAISNTVFIALSKDPGFGKSQQVNTGAQVWQ